MTPGAPSRPGGEGGRGWVLVALAWTALTIVAAVWLRQDARPPEWDHANHLERAVRCAGDLESGALQAVLERSSFYPPVVPCLAGAVYRVAPSDAVTAQSVILLSLALGMLAVYALGRRVAGEAAGIAAAIIFGTAPFVVFTMLRFQLDLPLAAMVAATLLAVHATDRFQRLGPSLVAGVLAGIGLLTKPPFVVYVIPVVLWMLLAGGRRAALRTALAMAVAAAISLPWYGPRLFGLPLQIANRSFKNAALEGKPETFSATALAFYPRWIFAQLGVLAVVLLLAGLVVALRRRAGWLIVAFVAPAVAFTLIQNKDLRYTLPLLPAAAVLGGLAVAALPRTPRRLLVGALVLVGALQVTAVTAGLLPAVRLPGVAVPWVLPSPPAREDWRHRAILTAIARDAGGRPATVSVVPNANFFSVANFRYYGLRDGLPLTFTRAWDDEPLGIDYMILKEGGDLGPSWTVEKPRRVAARLAADSALARAFPTIAEFPLPDGSRAILRARRLAPGVDAPPAALAQAVARAIRARVADVARDVERLDVSLAYDRTITQGRIARVEISVDAATVAEYARRAPARLRLHDARLVLRDVLVNPYAAAAGRFAPLDVGAAHVAALTVRGEDLQAFVRELKAFRRATVALERGALAVALAQPGPDVAARVRLAAAADRPFTLAFDGLRVGGVPVPGSFVNWVVRHYDPSAKLASRLPVPVTIGSVDVTPEAVRIGARAAGAS